ncbi:hypothetical protein LP420_25170 [Massilia sp. B-10]|nr:hypothetical protein LP420_25170 [Massilia sp. B-10]
MRPSFDGRWISYSGVQQKKGKTQYWLFDRKTKTDRLVFEHPAWGGGMPSFSPDGRYLSIDANYDTRWGNTSGAGMYLFDTATSSMVSVKLPTAIDQRSLGLDELVEGWPRTVDSDSLDEHVEFFGILFLPSGNQANRKNCWFL